MGTSREEIQLVLTENTEGAAEGALPMRSHEASGTMKTRAIVHRIYLSMPGSPTDTQNAFDFSAARY